MARRAARAFRVDQYMAGQTIAFVRIVDRIATVGERISHARAHRDDGEPGDADRVAEPAFVQQDRIEVVERARGDAGRLLYERAQIHDRIPIQERRECDKTVVVDMPAEREADRGRRRRAGGDHCADHARDLRDDRAGRTVGDAFGDLTADRAAHRIDFGGGDCAVVNVDADERVGVLADAQRRLRASTPAARIVDGEPFRQCARLREAGGHLLDDAVVDEVARDA